MKNIDVTDVPVEYKKAVAKELQGAITEVSYSVQNYINQSRQLVTNQNITSKEVGREIVNKGGAHDFNVWNNGAYNFIRLLFKKREEYLKPYVIRMTLNSY